ncbi:hypothetical protein [Caldimonas brevitalea]|uniref:hypothetical protein n=1 Tax=Caldimonas brevitalea TaxID=413882 RepID=UPI0012FB5C92|nr:hypothetical protein [Caldimonas brevitalea]
MISCTISGDAGGEIFRQVTAFDFEADALWFRFKSASDMYRMAEKVLPAFRPITAFLLSEVLPGAVNPKLSEFQGAFGRAKLLTMNKSRTFRKRVCGPSESFYLDGAPVSPDEDWKGYLRSVYNADAGFLLSGDGNINLAVEEALKRSDPSAFFGCLAKNSHAVGLFFEDHMGTRSIVFVGRSLPSSIEFEAASSGEKSEVLMESVRAYGERLANRRRFEQVLSKH